MEEAGVPLSATAEPGEVPDASSSGGRQLERETSELAYMAQDPSSGAPVRRYRPTVDTEEGPSAGPRPDPLTKAEPVDEGTLGNGDPGSFQQPGLEQDSDLFEGVESEFLHPVGATEMLGGAGDVLDSGGSDAQIQS
jgi:hypothetical protein